MFQFAHISDLHFPSFLQPSIKDLLGKRITGYCNWKLNRSHHLTTDILEALLQDITKHTPHHIAITGDIVNLALDSEFEITKNWLAKWGDPQNISLTLGNHDVYSLGTFKKAVKSFKPWLSGYKNFTDNQSNFQNHQAVFPFCRLFKKIALISLSSAITTPFFCAFGYVNKQQRFDLRTLLQQAREKDYFRVILIHHPPIIGATSNAKKLYNLKALTNILQEEGAELILHGHTHLPTLHYIEGKNHLIPVVGVASAAQNLQGKKPPSGYNLFTIEQKNKLWHCQIKRYQLNNEAYRFSLIESQTLYP